MRFKHVISIILLLILYNIIYCQNVFATGSIYVVPELEKVIKGEKFQISVNVKDTSVAACTLYLYFDETKVECISKYEHVSVQKNQVLYTWVDENGGKTAKENEEIVVFKFKAKETGIADFGIMGEFYDTNGNFQEMEFKGTRVQIQNERDIPLQVGEVEQTDTNTSNSLLGIMRLNKEGISPEFNPSIMEYYMLLEDNVDNLEVTAIPQNVKATVKITGNNNLEKRNK